MRRTRAGRVVLKTFVFVLGAAFVVMGLALAVLPGPLTIPPVLLGVYLWSTEFVWAERLRDRVMASAQAAWTAARLRPLRSAFATLVGLVLAGAAIYAAGQVNVVARLEDLLG